MYTDLNDKYMFYCQKILPLVYEDSLSYYEVLCKLSDYIKTILETETQNQKEIETLQAELSVVQQWILDFDTTFVEKLVTDYIAKVIKAVSFGLSSEGYFMAIIPNNWSEIRFGTIQDGELYGHLTLSYN